MNLKEIPFAVKYAAQLMNASVCMHHDLDKVYVLNVPGLQFYYVNNPDGPGINGFQVATEDGQSLYEGKDLVSAVHAAEFYLEDQREEVLVSGYNHAVVLYMDTNQDLTKSQAEGLVEQMISVSGHQLTLICFQHNTITLGLEDEIDEQEYEMIVNSITDNNEVSFKI